MRGESIKEVLLVYATLLIGNVSLAIASGPCERGLTWWNAKDATCLNCTICDPALYLTVIRPCQLHRDTLCVPLNQLNIIQWPRRPKNRAKHNDLSKTTPYSQTTNQAPEKIWRLPESREYIFESRHSIRDQEDETIIIPNYNVESENSDYIESTFEMKTEERPIKWDMQIAAISLAASGCVLFFFVVISLSLYHTRQWRRLKQNLHSDVEDITSKFKLMQTSVEATEQPPSTPVNHLYSNVHIQNASVTRDIFQKGLNNFYTQDKHFT